MNSSDENGEPWSWDFLDDTEFEIVAMPTSTTIEPIPAESTTVESTAIEPTTIEATTLRIIENMLSASEADNEAIHRAVQEIRACYTAKLPLLVARSHRGRPDHGLEHFMRLVMHHLFALWGAVPRSSIQHQRLIDLLIGLEQSAATDFDPQNPQLGWDRDIVEECALSFWRTLDPQCIYPESECKTMRNNHAFLGRLAVAGLFRLPALWRIPTIISSGLAAPPSGVLSHDAALVGVYCALISAEYIIATGDLVLVGMLQTFPGRLGEMLVMRQEWGRWAERLGQLACAEMGDEAELEALGLKACAEEAKQKVEGWLNAGL